ncbi:MAG: Fic family protein [Flavobacteriales bacterium]|nr:Fic family protein [Flavobacteriales bacterium]
MYLHQKNNWTDFIWDTEEVTPLLADVRHLQGKLLGKMEALGFDLGEESSFESLVMDVVGSSKIEGEDLNMAEVRSSVARRLGMQIPDAGPVGQRVELVVEMMLDATQNFQQPLDDERIFGWHNCLFPTGKSGMYTIQVGQYRDDTAGPMAVVSGPMGKERVHYVAPAGERLQEEMAAFLKWFNTDQGLDPVLKSAVAHFWFVTIHPMDDGNGRISRAIGDMQLARSENSTKRFYSMSQQIERDKKAYYTILEQVQKEVKDFTAWVVWYLNCFKTALAATDQNLAKVLKKAEYWQVHRNKQLNDRQLKMVNNLHDDFFGKLTSQKWAKICECHQNTAIRDIDDLITKGMLMKEEAGGRSTNYALRFPS